MLLRCEFGLIMGYPRSTDLEFMFSVIYGWLLTVNSFCVYCRVSPPVPALNLLIMWLLDLIIGILLLYGAGV